MKGALLLFLLLHSVFFSFSQVSPHYSQYYSNPLWLNPGLTGVIDGEYRLTAQYRNQWGNIDGGFKTPGISADMKATDYLSVGATFFDQSAGSAGYHYTNGYASVAFSGLRFGAQGNHRISIGLSGGFINRRFDRSKFQSGDQWSAATGFDPSIVSSEVYGKTGATAFDAGAGAVYFDATPGKKANLYAGFSAFHLTQPSDAFITGGNHDKLPVRYTGHAGVKLSLWENLSITPNLLYMRQGGAEEKMMGAYAQLRASGTVDLLLGANYRLNDSVVPYAGIYYKNAVLGLSYDANTSQLGKAAGNANTFELTLTLTGRKKGHVNTEPFVCPRL